MVLNADSKIEDLNKVTEKIIGCAIEVHKEIGPGLLESIYHKALYIELGLQGLYCESEKEILANYKNNKVGIFKADIVVENSIILELKSVRSIEPIFKAQLLSYLKLGKYKLGLLINFNTKLLKNGITRLVL